MKEERVGPTPETAAKRRDDFLADLPVDLQAAAKHVENAYRLAVAKVMLRTQRYERSDRVNLGEWNHDEMVLWTAYRLWMSSVRAARQSADLTITIVVDRVHPAEYDWRHGTSIGSSAERLMEQLGMFNTAMRKAPSVLQQAESGTVPIGAQALCLNHRPART